jgi:hypothetical protein
MHIIILYDPEAGENFTKGPDTMMSFSLTPEALSETMISLLGELCFQKQVTTGLLYPSF